MLARVFLLLCLVFAAPAAAQPFTPSEIARVDSVVAAALARSGIPSASVAVVRDGKIAFAKAYGRQSPDQPNPDPDARYPIASVSKQFVAAALLLLEDEGKLSLDDPVSRHLPSIGGGERMTVRQLLAHSAGLTDYWPQDYAFSAMKQPVTPRQILDRWARKPDFAPGTDFRYSNTGYVAAGLIIEKLTGQPLMQVLKARLFDPLGLSAIDMDDAVGPGAAAPTRRNALGPVRPETPAARGWLYAAGGLAMSATDLARWNIARIDRALLPAEDWTAQEAPQPLTGGRSANYGLGVVLRERGGVRSVEHSGEAVGFLSQNIVLPEHRVAVTVLVNGAFGAAQDEIADGILELLGSAPAIDGPDARLEDARMLFDELRGGQLDRALLTANASGFFTPETLEDYRTSLAPLGAPAALALLRPPALRGGFVQRVYLLTYPDGRRLVIGTFAEPGAHGRWEQFLVTPGS